MNSRHLLALLGACWLAVANSADTPAPQKLKDCAVIADNSQRLACYDALARQETETATVPAQAAENFGLPPTEADKKREVESIQSRLAGHFSSWERGTVFTLENGQVWKSIGDGSGYYPGIPDNPDVTITKSFFGAYWMKVSAAGPRIKVKRVK